MFEIEQNIATSFTLEDVRNNVLTINGTKDLRYVGRLIFANSIVRDYRIHEAVRKIIIRDVDEILENAFIKLPNLEEIIIENNRPNKPIKICENAFSVNPQLKKITLMGNDFELNGCFRENKSITDINISAKNVTSKNMPFENSGNNHTVAYLNIEKEIGDLDIPAQAKIISARAR